MKLMFVSHTEVGGSFRVGSHHLARELARRGHEVIHVSTPHSLVHRLLGARPERASQADRGPIRDEGGAVHVIPRTLLPVTLSAGRGGLRRALRNLGADDADAIIVDQPLVSGALSRSWRSRLVYRPTDMYTSGREARRQRRIIALSRAIVCTSEQVRENLGTITVPNMVMENGVEANRFVASVQNERSGFIYVGALDVRFDWEAVRILAATLPDQTFRIAGPLPQGTPELPSNVQLLGAVSYEQLPTLLGSARVALLPMTSHPQNLGRSPMKLFEYIAAGLPVLASFTPTLERLEVGETLSLYATYEELVTMARSTLEQGALASDTAQALAAEHDWERKAQKFEEFLESTLGGGPERAEAKLG